MWYSHCCDTCYWEQQMPVGYLILCEIMINSVSLIWYSNKTKKDQNTVTRKSHWTLKHLIDTLLPSNYCWKNLCQRSYINMLKEDTPHPNEMLYWFHYNTASPCVSSLYAASLLLQQHKLCSAKQYKLISFMRSFRHFRNDSTDVVEPFFLCLVRLWSLVVNLKICHSFLISHHSNLIWTILKVLQLWCIKDMRKQTNQHLVICVYLKY